MRARIVFIGTAKSGLGHLRRLSAIAVRLKERAETAELVLMTNAVPSGLSPSELGVFSDILLSERGNMAPRLVDDRCDLAVLDTLKLPGFERYRGPAALILRETPESNLEGFRRAGKRPWDQLLVPNPPEAWHPRIPDDFARSVVHAGWILRQTGPRGDSPSSGIVVATGGGGTAGTRAVLYPLLNRLIAKARQRLTDPVIVRQALGPRADGAALDEADEVFDPGPELNDVFRRADLVISTAGYNSVLELAGTDTPTMLVAIPRSFDDQMARARHWGALLGHGFEPGREDEAAAWLAEKIETPRRRAAIDLGSGGTDRAASALLELMCPVS